MDTEPPKQKIGNIHLPRSFIYLIVEDTRQRAIAIRQLAAEVQQKAQEITNRSRLAREIRRNASKAIHP